MKSLNLFQSTRKLLAYLFTYMVLSGTAIISGKHGMLLSQTRGSVVHCLDTFRDKILLNGLHKVSQKLEEYIVNVGDRGEETR